MKRIRLNIRVLGGLRLFVMRLSVKGRLAVNLSPLHTFVPKNVISEADLSAVNFSYLKVIFDGFHDVLLARLLTAFFIWVKFRQEIIYFRVWVSG